MQSVFYKLHELIYPPKTPFPDQAKDTFLGGVRLRDVPGSIDDFYRLLFADFRRRWGWLDWFKISPSHILPKNRFVSYSEFMEAFTKRSTAFDNLKEKYPIYRLANLNTHTQQDDFIRSYETKGLDGYFYFMGKKNPRMFQIFHQWHRAYIPAKEKGRHTYIIGKAGSGKSELMKNLIIQDIKKNDSCVIVLEPSGDLSIELARQKDLDRDRLIYIDCSITPATPVINPIELIQDTTDHLLVQTQAQIIRDTLVQMCNLNGQPLTAQMQSVLQPCLDVVVENGGSLYDIQRFVDETTDNSDLVELGKQHPKHGYFFQQRFDRKNLNESKNGIYQKLQQILGLSSVSDFFCGKTTIDLPAAIEQNKVIIFNLSKGHLGTFGSLYIGRMVIAILQNLIFQRAKIEKSARTPIRLYIDEFHDYITKSMEEIFVQGRKYKVDLTVATQTAGQGMDTQMAHAVLSNTNVKFAGQNDYRNTKTMSNETGTELEVLNKLQVGEFLTRISNGQAFVLTSSTEHLDDKTCISPEEWEKVLEEQISRYYIPRENLVPPAPPGLITNKTQATRATTPKQSGKDDEIFTPLYE